MDCSALFYKLTGRQALYNIMPLANIPSVMNFGILSYNQVPFEHDSIADPKVQYRRNKTIPGGLELHSYANLYFDPRNPMMYKRKTEYENLCVLAVNATILNIDGVVISDRNAAATFAQFVDPTEMQSYLNFDIIYETDWNDPDEHKKMNKKAIKCAEVLVPDRVPYSYIIGACVATTEIQHALQQTGFEKRIKIDPNIFFRKGGIYI